MGDFIDQNGVGKAVVLTASGAIPVQFDPGGPGIDIGVVDQGAPGAQAWPVTPTTLPPNAAQETGGNLATIAAAQGVGGTGITEPAGGSGLLGWLSGIYKAVTGTLTTVLAAGSAIVGKFGIDQTSPGTSNGVQVVAALPAGTNSIGTVQAAPITGAPTQASVSVGTGSTAVLAAAAASKWLRLENPSTNTDDIWINIAGAAAVVGSPCICLAPGVAIDFSATEFLPTAAINAIAASAATPLTVVYL